MRSHPRYVVSWQTEFDPEDMTPQQAAVEALRDMRDGLREGTMLVEVCDLDSKRSWMIGFREHVLEVIEFTTDGRCRAGA